jgi:cobalamin biosynthesis protein CobT
MKLEDVTHKLQDINPAHIFHDKMLSKLDILNEESDVKVTNTVETHAKNTLPISTKSMRPYSAAPNLQDKLIYKTSGSKSDVSALITEQSDLITQLTSVFKRKFKSKTKRKFVVNREDGKLDSRSIWQVPNGLSTQLFEETQKRHDTNVFVTVAIDLSGSQNKPSTNYGEKLRKLAVALDAALSNANVKHEVIGYGAEPFVNDAAVSRTYTRAQHNLQTVIYSDGKQMELHNLQPELWDNADGESLNLIAQRMAKIAPYKTKILLVISDGKPFLSGCDINILDAHLASVLKNLQANNIIALGFGWVSDIKKFFKKACVLKDKSQSTDIINFFEESL